MDEEHIHGWFELSYCSYLVLPRSILQSMPNEWQAKFVKLLEECNELYGDYFGDETYSVNLRSNIDGRFVKDDLAPYERGRRYITPRRSVSDE